MCQWALLEVGRQKKSVPSYEKILQLIDLGMTAEELFGKELSDKLKANSFQSSTASQEEFDDQLRDSLSRLLKEHKG